MDLAVQKPVNATASAESSPGWKEFTAEHNTKILRISEQIQTLKPLLKDLQNAEEPIPERRLLHKLEDRVSQITEIIATLPEFAQKLIEHRDLKLLCYAQLVITSYLSELTRSKEETLDYALKGLALLDIHKIQIPVAWKLLSNACHAEHFINSKDYATALTYIEAGLQLSDAYDKPRTELAMLYGLAADVHLARKNYPLAAKFAEAMLGTYQALAENAADTCSKRELSRVLFATEKLASLKLVSPTYSNLSHKEDARKIYNMREDLFGAQDFSTYGAALDLVIARLGMRDFETAWQNASSIRKKIEKELPADNNKDSTRAVSKDYAELEYLHGKAHVLKAFAEAFYAKDSDTLKRVIQHIYAAQACFIKSGEIEDGTDSSAFDALYDSVLFLLNKEAKDAPSQLAVKDFEHLRTLMEKFVFT